MDIQLKRGLLDACVLSVLEREDSYGYKIIKDLADCVEISESTLYPILKRLENSGSVSVYSVEHQGRLRKYYRITEAGHQQILIFLKEWESVMRIYQFIREGQNHDQA